MLSEASQSIAPDVAFTNVPVAIDARVKRRARVVEVNRAHVAQADRAANDFDRCF